MQHVLDLTDEQGLLAEDRVTYDPEGVRRLLAALNLKPTVAPAPVPAVIDAREIVAGQASVFDLAVYRATGDRHLASIFSSAA